MSFGRAAGPILATVCGVCTAYVALAPELQRQAAEKQQSQFNTQHDSTSPTSCTTTPATASPETTHQISNSKDATTTTTTTTATASNDQSIGRQIRQSLDSTKSEIKFEVAAAEPRAGWFGLGAWAGTFGGGAASSSTSSTSSSSSPSRNEKGGESERDEKSEKSASGK